MKNAGPQMGQVELTCFEFILFYFLSFDHKYDFSKLVLMIFSLVPFETIGKTCRKLPPSTITFPPNKILQSLYLATFYLNIQLIVVLTLIFHPKL